jgi:hypothetical protein
MNDDTRHESDAFSALGWGLRRYWWVVLDAVLVLGVLLPGVLLNLATPEYESQAQVGPVSALQLPNVDILPRTATEVFGNGAVAKSVSDHLDSPFKPVVPKTVELVAAQDSVVMTIIGRGSSAQDAKEAANTAAGSFIDELNKSSAALGTFGLHQAAAEGVEQPSLRGVPLVAAGLAAGLVAGVGIVAAILAWRRPVLGAATAERVAGAPVVASVQLDPGRDEIQGLPRLCHHLLHDAAPVIFLTGPRLAREDRHRLATELRSVLAGPRSVTVLAGSHQSFWGLPPEKQGGPDADLLIVDGPTQAELMLRPPESLTLMVVPEGIPTNILQREAEYHLDGGRSGIVVVRHGGRLRTLFSGRSRSAEDGKSAG